MAKRKVLFIMPDLPVGGAERMVLNLLSDLTRLSFEPTLFLGRRFGEYVKDVPQNVPLVCGVDSFRAFIPHAPRILSRALKLAHDSDVIVGALPFWSTYLAYLCGRLSGKPVVGWIQNTMELQLPSRRALHLGACKLVYPRLDRLVCVSRGAAASIARLIQIDQDKSTTILNYLNWEWFDERVCQAIPASLAHIMAKPTVLAVGRLVPEKGFDVLIRAHAHLRTAGLDINLLVLGDGPMRVQLRALADSLSVGTSVFLPGFVSNPYPLMRATQAFVLSSRFEGLPLVLLEALAAGAPVVACDCQSGPREVLEDGKYGFLVAPEDDGALAMTLAKLLREPELRRVRSAGGVARARTFSRDSALPLWQRVLSENVSGPP